MDSSSSNFFLILAYSFQKSSLKEWRYSKSHQNGWIESGGRSKKDDGIRSELDESVSVMEGSEYNFSSGRRYFFLQDLPIPESFPTASV